MKAIIKFIVGFALLVLNLQAANFHSANLLQGTNLTLYTGTAATTFKFDDTYNTNRRFVMKPYTLDTSGNIVTTTTVIPKATNSVSGAIVPSFEKQVGTWPNARGDTPTNVVITAFGSNGAAFTNTIALTFVKSVDGGNTWATDDPNGTFSFTYDTTLYSAVSTNVPGNFLNGASHIRLWKVVTGANPAGTSTVTLGKVLVSGFVPSAFE